MIQEKLPESCMDSIIGKKHVFSAVMRVESGDGSFAWSGARGEMNPKSRYFIASVTKLYVTAVIMSLVEENKLRLDDKINKYIPQDYLEKLHVFKGVDYSNTITIMHLISNTSGIPDYFFYKEPGKPRAADSLFSGNDEAWGFDKMINAVKNMKPKFPPDYKNKVHYSDTNYRLLGKIIEIVTEKNTAEAFKERIFDVLDLRNTYMYSDPNDDSPAVLYYKGTCVCVPNYMASIGSEGGIVSTADEVMIFTKAFFSGQFFPKEKIEALKKWRMLLPPPGLFYFGIGLEKMPTPRIMMPIKPIREIVGFWGQTSSFAWYNSDTDLYFTGTANQCNGAGHYAVSRAIFKLIQAML